MRRIAIAIAALLALTASTSAWAQADPVYGFDDEPAVAPTLEAFSPRVYDAPWFESWTIPIWLDDGTYVFVQYLTSSVGFGIELQGTARALLVEPHAVNEGGAADGVVRGTRGFQGRDGDWDWDREEPLNIWFRDCYVRGDGDTFEVYFRSREHDFFVELALEAEAPLWQAGDGRAEFGWDRHDFYTSQMVPRVRVTGRINRKADREAPDNWQDVTGVGLIEHARMNAFPFVVAERFTRFRALRDDGLTVLAQVTDLPEGFDREYLGMVLVLLDGVPVFESTDVTFTLAEVRPVVGDGLAYDVPWAWDVVAQSGNDSVALRVVDAEIVSSESPLGQLSSFMRTILARLMSPRDIDLSTTYEAYVSIDGHTAWVSGQGWVSFNQPIGRTP